MDIMKSVFDRIDEQRRSFLGITPAAVIWNVSGWRDYFTFCVICASVAWFVFGFDSTWSQTKPFIDYFSTIFIKNPLYELRNGIPLAKLWAESSAYYGLGNHFSAPVIYGIAFIILSRHMEGVGIKKSLNFCTCTGLSLASIGIFELMWNTCFAIFHGQIWVITFQWKQVTNLVSFIAFIMIGLLCILYLYLDGYKPNITKLSLSLLLLTAVCWGIWINYPLPVDHITVATTAGPWTNSDKFPQTSYTVDIDPTDGVAIGVPHHVQNDTIHFVNTFTKIVQTVFILSICMVRKVGVNTNG